MISGLPGGVKLRLSDLPDGDERAEVLTWVFLTPDTPPSHPPGTGPSKEGINAPSQTCPIEFQPYGASRSKEHAALGLEAHAWDLCELSLAKATWKLCVPSLCRCGLVQERRVGSLSLPGTLFAESLGWSVSSQPFVTPLISKQQQERSPSRKIPGGARGSQSVGRPTSAHVMMSWSAQGVISQSVSSSPASGSVLTARSLEPASESVSPSLSAPPLLTLYLSVSQKHLKNNFLKKKNNSVKAGGTRPPCWQRVELQLSSTRHQRRTRDRRIRAIVRDADTLPRVARVRGSAASRLHLPSRGSDDPNSNPCSVSVRKPETTAAISNKGKRST